MMRLMAFLLLSLVASQAAAVGLFARVDRTQLSIDETFELSLESQGSAAFQATAQRIHRLLFEPVADTTAAAAAAVAPSAVPVPHALGVPFSS